MSEEYLSHYGILGMKWGVRRFQREDGSYTKRGLERYREAEKKYDDINSKYKAAKKNKSSSTNSLRSKRMSAKKEMSKSYGELKRVNRIDQGKRLVQEGKTITKNNAKKDVALTISMITGYTAYKMGKSYVNRMRGQVIGKTGLNFVRASEAAVVGSAAIYGILHNKYENENSKIRAYYNR